jgi:predicted metal-dependent phosphoesterase TrpH
MTHKELLEKAPQYNVSVVAFTDHDCLPSKEVISYLRNFKSDRVKWISGIEISASLPPESGGGQDSGLHIIGLFVDPTNSDLAEHCIRAKEARLARMKHIVGALVSLGFDITEAECLNASKGEVVAKPHIVEALTAKPKNMTRMHELIRKVAHDAENDADLKKRYDDMMQSAEYQYPYQMFLSKDALIPGIYTEDKYWISLDDTVRIIRGAGGVASLAHYFTIKKKLSLEVLDLLLSQNRLDGLETIFGLWNYGTEKWAETEKDATDCARLVSTHGKVCTGGVDLHYEDDFVKFNELTDFSKQTYDLVEHVVSLTRVSTRWSSL